MSNCVQQPEAKKAYSNILLIHLNQLQNELSPGLHRRKMDTLWSLTFIFPGQAILPHATETQHLFYRLHWIRVGVRFPFSVRSINRCRCQKSGWVLTNEERHRGNKDLGNTYRIEVQSESRFLVLIHPWHTCAAHFRQPAAPHQQCHLWKLTSSSDGRTKIDSYCVVHTAIATRPAVPTPLRVVIKRDKCSVALLSCLSLWLYCL